MLLLDYWLHSGVIVRLAVCFIFSIKLQRPWRPTKGNAEMRNMSKKTWKLRVWNHMTEMQKLDILLKHAKVPHTYALEIFAHFGMPALLWCVMLVLYELLRKNGVVG